MTISPNTFLEVEKITTALRMGAAYPWADAIKAFESEDTQAKILDGMIAADDAASIVGLFVPPANAVAIGLGVAIAVEPTAYRFLTWVYQQPAPRKFIDGVVTWGNNTRNSIVSTFTNWFKSIPS